MRRVEGQWWDPALPDLRIPGVLEHDPRGNVILRLYGWPHPNITSVKEIEARPELARPLVIHGRSLRQQDVSVLGSQFQPHTFVHGGGGIVRCAASVDAALLGRHVTTSLTDLRLPGLTLGFAGLAHWASRSGFDLSTPPIVQRGGRLHVNVSYTSLPPVTLYRRDGMEIMLRFPVTVPTTSAPMLAAHIAQRACIDLRIEHGAALDRFRRVGLQLRHFLTLMMGRRAIPLRIEVCDPPKEGQLGQPPVQIWGLFQHIESSADGQLWPLEPLIPYGIGEESVAHMATVWLEKSEYLDPVADLYFGTLYNPELYPENRFQAVVQAIESYHRRTVGGADLPPNDHEARIDSIVAACPTEHADWLKQKLRYSNEPSLRQRLKALTKTFAKPFGRFVSRLPEFVDNVVNTRNYLTHYGDDLKDHVLRGDHLAVAQEQLGVLLQMCLLRELGVEMDEIDHIFSRRWHVRHLRKS